MRTRKRLGVVAAAVAAAVGLSTAVTVAPSVARVRSQTAPKVLKIASISYSAFYADLAKGAQARFDDANKNKELPGGRTVDFIGLIDDKTTADGTIAAIRQAKEQEGVWAVVGSVAPYLTPDYVNQQKLPWVGWGINDAFCTHGAKTPWYIIAITGALNCTNAAYGSAGWSGAVAAQLGGANGKTVGCITEDNDSGKSGLKIVCDAFKASGFKVAYADANVPAAPAVVSDWSPYVQKAMTSGTGGKPIDVFAVITNVSTGLSATASITQAGYPGVIATTGTYAPVLTGPMKGANSFIQWATGESVTQEGNTEMTKIVQSLARAGIPADKVTQTALAGWFSADMFVKIAKKAGKNLTPEAWAKAASKFNYEIKDTIGPTTYPNAFAVPTPCSELAESNGTAWTITQPFACYDSIDNKSGKLVPYSDTNGNVKY
jgi:hypothetical protein